jgi:hypothetical protein
LAFRGSRTQIFWRTGFLREAPTLAVVFFLGAFGASVLLEEAVLPPDYDLKYKTLAFKVTGAADISIGDLEKQVYSKTCQRILVKMQLKRYIYNKGDVNPWT